MRKVTEEQIQIPRDMEKFFRELWRYPNDVDISSQLKTVKTALCWLQNNPEVRSFTSAKQERR